MTQAKGTVTTGFLGILNAIKMALIPIIAVFDILEVIIITM